MTTTVTKRKRCRVPDGTVFLDMAYARRYLAAEHAELMAGPKAQPCSCPRPWTFGRECFKCGRETRP